MLPVVVDGEKGISQAHAQETSVARFAQVGLEDCLWVPVFPFPSLLLWKSPAVSVARPKRGQCARVFVSGGWLPSSLSPCPGSWALFPAASCTQALAWAVFTQQLDPHGYYGECANRASICSWGGGFLVTVGYITSGLGWTRYFSKITSRLIYQASVDFWWVYPPSQLIPVPG